MSIADTCRQLERDMISVANMDKLISSGGLSKMTAETKSDPEFQRVFKMWDALRGERA